MLNSGNDIDDEEEDDEDFIDMNQNISSEDDDISQSEDISRAGSEYLNLIADAQKDFRTAAGGGRSGSGNS